jgi:hypothetical protein
MTDSDEETCLDKDGGRTWPNVLPPLLAVILLEARVAAGFIVFICAVEICSMVFGRLLMEPDTAWEAALMEELLAEGSVGNASSRPVIWPVVKLLFMALSLVPPVLGTGEGGNSARGSFGI